MYTELEGVLSASRYEKRYVFYRVEYNWSPIKECIIIKNYMQIIQARGIYSLKWKSQTRPTQTILISKN